MHTIIRLQPTILIATRLRPINLQKERARFLLINRLMRRRRELKLKARVRRSHRLHLRPGNSSSRLRVSSNCLCSVLVQRHRGDLAYPALIGIESASEAGRCFDQRWSIRKWQAETSLSFALMRLNSTSSHGTFHAVHRLASSSFPSQQALCRHACSLETELCASLICQYGICPVARAAPRFEIPRLRLQY